MNKEQKQQLLTAIREDPEVRQAVLQLVEETLGDLVGVREYLDQTLNR